MEKKSSDYIEFYMGVITIAAGLFFLLSKAVVHSGFYTWSVGGLSVSSGIVIIPLMAGIIGLVHNPKSFFAKLITIAGSIFIVSSIILNIRISFRTTTMFDYVVMMVLIAAGIGLMLKANSMAREDNKKSK
ncbi:MAG: hypothetical protein IKJ36_03620 [Clostridia bacterium]|nr:hypothetical protein [Clostridia bacterium]